MVSTGDDFFSWAGGLINNTAIFQAGSNFVVILLAMLVVAILISPKKPRNWIKLFLPILVWFKVLGLQVNFMFLIIAGIMFIIETMSLEVMGSTLQAGIERFSGVPFTPTKIKERIREKKTKTEYKKLVGKMSLDRKESMVEAGQVAGYLKLPKSRKIPFSDKSVKEAERILQGSRISQMKLWDSYREALLSFQRKWGRQPNAKEKSKIAKAFGLDYKGFDLKD